MNVRPVQVLHVSPAEYVVIGTFGHDMTPAQMRQILPPDVVDRLIDTPTDLKVEWGIYTGPRLTSIGDLASA